jgi:hypothetical protein
MWITKEDYDEFGPGIDTTSASEAKYHYYLNIKCSTGSMVFDNLDYERGDSVMCPVMIHGFTVVRSKKWTFRSTLKLGCRAQSLHLVQQDFQKHIAIHLCFI